MTDKTQPTAHAEITAPISADLRRLPALSEQDAGLLEQAASMLEGLQNDERNRGNCSTAEGAACSADAVRRLAVQLLLSTETAQCLRQGAEPDKHMTIGRALRQGLRAEPWISGGPGGAACVGLCAIQLQGWWHTAETAKAYADAFNRGADDMRAALQAAPPAPAAVAVPDLRLTDEQIEQAFISARDEFMLREVERTDKKLRLAFARAVLHSARAALAAAPAQEHATQLAGQGVRAGFALVPLRLTPAMDEVLQEEGWQWADLLAAAKALTEADYDALSRDDLTDTEVFAVADPLFAHQQIGGRVPSQDLDGFRELIGSALSDAVFQAAAPAQAQEDARDAVRALIATHAEMLEDNAYAYFELAYTRQTGWMAWITDKPLYGAPVVNPDRKVLTRGQGDTPDEACADAARAAQGGDKP